MFTSFWINCNHPFSSIMWLYIFPLFLLLDKNNSTLIMKFIHIGKQPNYTYKQVCNKIKYDTLFLFILFWKTYNQYHLTDFVDHMCMYRMTKSLQYNWLILYRWHSVSYRFVYQPCKNKYPRHILMVIFRQYVLVVYFHHLYN